MKKINISLILLITTLMVNAQKTKFEYGLETFGFVDNREYKSSFQTAQTLSGIRLSPEIGINFGGHHHVRAGVNGLYEFGTNKGWDDAAFSAYYLYDWKPFTFMLGSFPRKYAQENFPAVFFYDSITYYRPNMTGIFWQFAKKYGNISVFLDWTSKQTETQRETFFIGSSGIYKRGVLYGKYQYYMYHYALKKNGPPTDHIHDNGLLHVALGVDFTHKTFFDTICVNVGYLQGQERRRNDPGTWKYPKGIFVEANLEWQGLGIKNTFYSGEGLMVYPEFNDGNLYWGDPYYRAKTYNRADIYLNVINSNNVNAKFVYSFHYAENKLSDQQQLLLTVNLGNIHKKENKKPYVWTKWFRGKQE